MLTNGDHFLPKRQIPGGRDHGIKLADCPNKLSVGTTTLQSVEALIEAVRRINSAVCNLPVNGTGRESSPESFCRIIAKCASWLPQFANCSKDAGGAASRAGALKAFM
jgi:hypothetical protein